MSLTEKKPIKFTIITFLKYIFLLFCIPFLIKFLLNKSTLDVAKKKSLKQISIIVLVAFIIISFIFVKTMKKSLINNWENVKCKPYVIPFAGMLNAPKGAKKFTYTLDNIKICLSSVIQKIYQMLLKPFNLVMQLINTSIEAIRNLIKKARKKLSIIKGFISILVKKVLDKFRSITVVISYLTKRLKDILGKQHAIFLSVQNLVTAINTTLTGVAKGPLGYLASNFMSNIPNFWPMSIDFNNCMCFGLHTPIQLIDEDVCFIENIRLHDVLKGGSVVNGIIKYKSPNGYKLDNGKQLMYSYFSVIVSGEHLVQEKGLWKKVMNSQYANPIIYDSDKYIYCLITSDNRIIVNDILFTDFEEHDNYNLHSSIDQLTTYVLNNPKESLLGEQICLDENNKVSEKHQYPMGIQGDILITLEYGKKTLLKDIQIGDELLDCGSVLSIIELDSSITSLYTYTRPNINTIICSGSQLVLEEDKWIRVYESNFSEILKPNTSVVLFHVITTTGVLVINSLVCRDYLEHRNKELHNLSNVLTQIELNK